MKEPNKFADMSTADFKDRIKAIKRGLNPDDEPIIGAPHAHPCVVRRPTDRGYNPPAREEAAE